MCSILLNNILKNRVKLVNLLEELYEEPKIAVSFVDWLPPIGRATSIHSWIMFGADCVSWGMEDFYLNVMDILSAFTEEDMGTYQILKKEVSVVKKTEMKEFVKFPGELEWFEVKCKTREIAEQIQGLIEDLHDRDENQEFERYSEFINDTDFIIGVFNGFLQWDSTREWSGIVDKFIELADDGKSIELQKGLQEEQY